MEFDEIIKKTKEIPEVIQAMKMNPNNVDSSIYHISERIIDLSKYLNEVAKELKRISGSEGRVNILQKALEENSNDIKELERKVEKLGKKVL